MGLFLLCFLPFDFWGKGFNFPLEIRDVRKRQAVGAFPFDFLLTLSLNHVGIRSGCGNATPCFQSGEERREPTSNPRFFSKARVAKEIYSLTIST